MDTSLIPLLLMVLLSGVICVCLPKLLTLVGSDGVSRV